MGSETLSKNGSVEREFLLKYDGHLYPTKVLIPHAVDSQDSNLPSFVNDFFHSLINSRNQLSVLPSKKGSHGRPRSKREYGDILKQQQQEKNRINHALSIIFGNTPGVIEVIHALNTESGKSEPVGVRAISTQKV